MAAERHLVVVGGGIAGLAAAHRAASLRPDVRVTLIEASPRLGGVLQTDRDGDWLIECSADNFITTDPIALQFCREIGVADELIETDARYRRAFVVHNGRPVPIPPGVQLMVPSRLLPVLASPAISWLGKLRLAAEPLIAKRRSTGDESLHDFAVRRLGRPFYEQIVEPLVAGIYTADPRRLSVAAALPQFAAMEREYGSLYRAMRRKAAARNSDSGARYSRFVAPRAGMQRLVDAAAETLPPRSLRVGCAVETIVRRPNGELTVQLANDSPLEVDGVVLALPAFLAASLVSAASPSLSEELSAIEFASSAVVCAGYERSALSRLPEGFGLVVPSVEKRPILAASFSSVKFPGRAPAGSVLIRVFFGGAMNPEIVERDDEELYEIAHRQLVELIGAKRPPTLRRIVRWRRAMPQYHVGHLDRLTRIEQHLAATPGLALAGASYRGVGVPQCIAGGRAAAERLLNQLGDVKEITQAADPS